MKLIVVVGRHGTKITGELISEMLSPEYVVRRQLERPFWDFSIPLAILGFEDKQYSRSEWIVLVVKSFLRLLLGKSNFTWTILQMNTDMEEIAIYWAGLIEAELCVFVNVSPGPRELENLIMKRTVRRLVVPKSLLDIAQQNVEKGTEVVTYGNIKGCDLQVKDIKQDENGTRIRGFWGDDQDEFEISAVQSGEFMIHPLVSTITALLVFGLPLKEVSAKLAKIQIDIERFIYSDSRVHGTRGRKKHS